MQVIRHLHIWNSLMGSNIKILEMKNILKILIIAGLLFTMGSCYYDTYPEDEVIIPEEVSYQNDIEPLWANDCTGCHRGQTPPNLSVGVSYESLMDGYVVAFKPDESILYLTLIHDPSVSPMPNPNTIWPASQTKLVEAWILQGAKDN